MPMRRVAVDGLRIEGPTVPVASLMFAEDLQSTWANE